MPVKKNENGKASSKKRRVTRQARSAKKQKNNTGASGEKIQKNSNVIIYPGTETNAKAPSDKKTVKRTKRQNSGPKPAKPARRRRQRKIMAAIGLLFIIGIGVWLSVTFLFKIQRYDVRGESPYTQQELVAAFGYSVGDNLYGFSTENVQQRMQEALPYIETISVGRRPPSTVVFEVTPAAEIYYLQISQEFVVLSESYKVLRKTQTEPLDLIRIEGLQYIRADVGSQLVFDTEVADAVSVAQEEQEIEEQAQSEEEERQGDVPPPLPTPEEALEIAAAEAEQETAEGEDEENGEDDVDAENVEDESTDSDESTESTDDSTSEESDSSDTSDEEEQPQEDEEEQKADPELAKESFDAFKELLNELKEAGITDVNWVNVENPLDIQFGWQNRVTVKLGARTGLSEKLSVTHVLLTDTTQGLVMPEDTGTLDMQYYLSTGNGYFMPQ